MTSEQTHETGIAGRYAKAIFELAQEQHCIEAVEADFLALSNMLRQSSDLIRLVRSPVFSAELHVKAMKALLERMGASRLTTNFVLVIASKRRLFYLSDIMRAFARLRARDRGEVQAEVTSARALSEEEMVGLRNVLRSRLGREPRLETKIDPTILGGLVVKVGSRMIDSSLRNKLTGIRAAMRGR